MKTKLFLLLIIFLVTGIASIAFQERQDHKVLFEKAKYTMETKADLKEAITLFESLITTYPNEKEYAAKAQLHIGLCYEKLGLKEAQNAYQKVIDNYPGQREEFRIAKEKLSRIVRAKIVVQKGDEEFVVRKIGIGPDWGQGEISPDGRNI